MIKTHKPKQFNTGSESSKAHSSATGCLKLTATAVCVIAIICYACMGLFTGTVAGLPPRWVLSLLSALFAFLIWLIWRPAKLTAAVTHKRLDARVNGLENDVPDTVVVPRFEIEGSPFLIPQSVLSLLWLKNGPFRNCSDAEEDEPSAIDLMLPIDLEVSEDDKSTDIEYYPSYIKLTPRQRTVYLRWLQDITEKVPIGYVFIFYYGLERFLFTEKFEQALQTMALLRKHHENASFLAYSADAMLVGCLINNRLDLIDKIDIEKSSSDLYLYIKGSLFRGLSPLDLMETCRMWGFTNTRYIKNQSQLFQVKLESLLLHKYNQSFFPLSHSDYVESEQSFPIVLANYSLSLEERYASAKDITTNTHIKNTVLELLQETHQEIKQTLAEMRRKKPCRNAEETAAPTTTAAPSDSSFCDDENSLDAGGTGFTNENASNLRETIFKRAPEYFKEDLPPKSYYRSFEENIEIGQYYSANAEYIDRLEQDIWLPDLYSFESIDAALNHAQRALIAAQKLAEYCSKTELGRHYFEDMWMHCHNSQNPDFSFIDTIKERYLYLTHNYDTIKRDFELHKKRQQFLKTADEDVYKFIQNNPGILQKDVHKHFDPDLKPTIGTAINHLLKAERLDRIKQGNSFVLHAK